MRCVCAVCGVCVCLCVHMKVLSRLACGQECLRWPTELRVDWIGSLHVVFRSPIDFFLLKSGPAGDPIPAGRAGSQPEVSRKPRPDGHPADLGQTESTDFLLLRILGGWLPDRPAGEHEQAAGRTWPPSSRRYDLRSFCSF